MLAKNIFKICHLKSHLSNSRMNNTKRMYSHQIHSISRIELWRVVMLAIICIHALLTMNPYYLEMTCLILKNHTLHTLLGSVPHYQQPFPSVELHGLNFKMKSCSLAMFCFYFVVVVLFPSLG